MNQAISLPILRKPVCTPVSNVVSLYTWFRYCHKYTKSLLHMIMCVLVMQLNFGSMLINFESNGLPIELHNSNFQHSVSIVLTNTQVSLQPLISTSPFRYRMFFVSLFVSQNTIVYSILSYF